MSLNYSTHASKGDPMEKYVMYVFVYPDDENDKDVCQNQILPAITEACDQIYSESAVVDYYQVSYASDFPNEWDSAGDSDEDKDTALDKFRGYLSDQDGVPFGSHLLVDNNRVGGGVADGGDITCQNERSGWIDWAPAVYGSEGDSGEYQQNIAIHEVLHNFIDFCISDVNSMAPDEHSLGQMYSNTFSDPASPMITSYESELKGKGDCSSNIWVQSGHTQTLSSCTIDALDATATEHVDDWY